MYKMQRFLLGCCRRVDTVTATTQRRWKNISRVLKNPLEVRTVTAKRAKPALGRAEGEAGDRQVDWGK
jgi:hypothetical protein